MIIQIEPNVLYAIMASITLMIMTSLIIFYLTNKEKKK